MKLKALAAIAALAGLAGWTDRVHAMSPYSTFARTILHSGTANAPAPGQTTTNQYGQKSKAPSAPPKAPPPPPKK